ncbi:MAG: hypothetical protein ACTSU2_03700 [Promethearchaeota archaeon]
MGISEKISNSTLGTQLAINIYLSKIIFILLRPNQRTITRLRRTME